jgi:hypothetical protein
MDEKQTEYIWSDRCVVMALMTKEQFERLEKGSSGTPETYSEVEEKLMFVNKEDILWKKTYGYPLEYFRKCKNLANILELRKIFMPDSEMEFPMHFTNDEKSLYIILVPRMFPEWSETREFIEKMVGRK